jgi:hypothetical protein
VDFVISRERSWVWDLMIMIEINVRRDVICVDQLAA